MTATFSDLTGWVEVDSTGAKTSQPLGTSGSFCIKLDYGLATEETVKCTSLNPSTGVITFATRGFDGTTAVAHAAGSSSKLNVFPVETATDWVNLQATATTASTTASSALSTANAALPKSGGTMSGAIAMGASKITGLANGTASTDAAAFGQIIPLSTVTTAGDLIVGSGSGAVSRLGIGTANQVVTVNSGATGLTYATPATWFPKMPSVIPTVASGTFTTAISNFYLVPTTSGTVTVTLPKASGVNQNVIGFQLQVGSNPLVINSFSGDTIQGTTLTSIQLTNVGQSVFMIALGASNQWNIIANSAIPAGTSGFTVGGDLTGVLPNPKVDGLQGYAVSATAPTSGQALVWDGTNWAPSTISATDATKLPLTGGTLTGALNGTAATFTGELTGSDLVPSGLTGATTATRYVGGTVNSAPASGTFAKGDFVVDQSGTIWVCTTAGTPGTWTTTISSHLSLRSASATVTRNETTIFSGSTASQTLTAPSSPIDGSTWTVINKSSVSVALSFTPSMVPLGSGTGVTSYTVSAGGAYSFVNYNGSQWYMVGTNGADHMVDYSSVALSAWGAAAANVAMGSNKITGLADGTVSTDAAAFGQVSTKANSAITISTTAPLSGGGDLSANRTLTIADGTTSVKGAVQLTDSTSSTSTTTAATPNSVKTAYDLANAALPKSGGTMSGNIAMNSVARMTGLLRPSALGQPMRVDEATGIIGPNFYSQNVVYGWTTPPDALVSGSAQTIASALVYVVALNVPYDCTATGVRFFLTNQGTSISAANITLMNATTSLATVNAPITAFNSTGNTVVTAAFTATASLTAGTYWIAYYATFAGNAPVITASGASGQNTFLNIAQTATSNSLATTRVGVSITIPAVGSSLTTTPTQGSLTRIPFFAIY
jgi:hypothetical protein